MADPITFPLGSGVALGELELDPHPVLARLRSSEPVSWVPVLGGWLVTAYEPALAVMRAPATFTVDDPRFSTAQVVGPSMLSRDGGEHRRHRTAFVAAFRPPAVRERFTDAAAEAAHSLLDALPNSGYAELRRQFAGPLAAAIMTRALGLERSEVASVLAWYDGIVAAVTDITAGRSPSPAGAEAFRALRRRIQPIVERPDVASLLSSAAHGSSLASHEIISNAAVLLFGGIETMEGMISNAVLHLLANPEQLSLARTDPAVLDAALEESLRLEPAAALIDRYATVDVELGRAEIARGELVRVSIAGANRDPAIFAHPNRFDPARSRAAGRRHLAFAQGPHVCLGLHLARLEARIGLATLLGRLTTLRLDPQRPSPIRGLVFRKPPGLYVMWT